MLIVRKPRQKACAYITHQKRLLVFRHVDVPVGCIARHGVPSFIADHDRMLPQLFDVLQLKTV
jgi:hypothetical protein